MFVVRYAVLAALAIWTGGMLAIGAVVAPAAFQALPAADPQNGRVVAGLLFGEVLRQFSLVAYGCGAVVVLGLLVLKFVGPPPRAFNARIAIAGVMLASAVYAGVPVLGEIGRIQTAVSGPIGQLPESDPRRARFDALHRLSTTLMSVNLGLGFVSLFWFSRE